MVQLRSVLFETTGLEGDIKFLKSFIYKGFRYSLPKILLTLNVVKPCFYFSEFLKIIFNCFVF